MVPARASLLAFALHALAARPTLPAALVSCAVEHDGEDLDIARARADGADVVIVVPHWGVGG